MRTAVIVDAVRTPSRRGGGLANATVIERLRCTTIWKVHP